MKKISVIINLGSKLAHPKIGAEILDLFKKHGAEVEIHTATPAHSIEFLAQQAAANGIEILVAAGGDGTISTIAQVVAGKEGIALGVLPIGTHNNFSKDFGIPAQLDLAVENIIQGKIHKINIGEVNGKYFINNSSLGVYPSIVLHRETKEKFGMSRLRAFFEATIFALQNLREHRVVLNIAGKEIIRHTPLVFVGNGFYETRNFGFGKRDKINADKFSVYVLQRTHSRDLIRIGIKNFFNLLEGEEKFEDFSTDALEIATDSANPRIALDGEIFETHSPLKYTLHHNFLNVVKK